MYDWPTLLKVINQGHKMREFIVGVEYPNVITSYTSVFGSSALLGYPLIAELFPHNSAVLTEAAFVSELGVGLPLFTIGVMIAIYFGDSKQNEKNCNNLHIFHIKTTLLKTNFTSF